MITSRPFGALSDGTPVTCYRLSVPSGAYVDILDYGATVQSLVVPDRNGQLTDVILGYPDAIGYETGTFYFGATVGRHANRIGGGAFTLNGATYRLECNSGPNHSHGGFHGFHQRMFTPEICGSALDMHLFSPDGDQGYPGNLRLTVRFTFTPDLALNIDFTAVSDQDTVVSLTNHCYFDLSGGQDPLGQLLWIDADQYTENDENTLPTGVIASVAGTPFDFRQPKPVGQDLTAQNRQLRNCNGYDHNFALKNGGRPQIVARLSSPVTGIVMEETTDLPGLQLYSGNFVDAPNGKRPYGFRSGVCLEGQFFPNAMALEQFQKPILRRNDEYRHVIRYQFKTELES